MLKRTYGGSPPNQRPSVDVPTIYPVADVRNVGIILFLITLPNYIKNLGLLILLLNISYSLLKSLDSFTKLPHPHLSLISSSAFSLLIPLHLLFMHPLQFFLPQALIPALQHHSCDAILGFICMNCEWWCG